MRYFMVCYYYSNERQEGHGCIFIKRPDGNFCDMKKAAIDGAKSENVVPTFVFEFQNEQDFLSAQNKEA